MTRIGERYQPAIATRYVDTLCDFCGLSVYRNGSSDVSIKAELGESYPEADLREVYSIDVCPECFRTTIIPAIEALGISFRVRAAENWSDAAYYQVIHDAVKP